MGTKGRTLVETGRHQPFHRDTRVPLRDRLLPPGSCRYDPVAHARVHETFRQRSTPSGKSDTEREVRVEPEIVRRGALQVNRPRVRQKICPRIGQIGKALQHCLKVIQGVAVSALPTERIGVGVVEDCGHVEPEGIRRKEHGRFDLRCPQHQTRVSMMRRIRRLLTNREVRLALCAPSNLTSTIDRAITQPTSTVRSFQSLTEP